MSLLARLLGAAAALVHVHVGLATTFSSVDRWNPDPFLACLRRPLDDEHDLVIAHRTLPCRSRVLLCLPRTRRCVVAVVGDRGPVHADLDLAPAVRRRLRHSGREVVLFVPLSSGTPTATARLACR